MITTKFEVQEECYGDKLIPYVDHIISAADEIAAMNRGKRMRSIDRFRVLLDGEAHGFGRRKPLRRFLKTIAPGRQCIIYRNSKGGAAIHFDAGFGSGRFEAVPKIQEPTGLVQSSDLESMIPQRPARNSTISRNAQVDVDIEALKASDPFENEPRPPSPANSSAGPANTAQSPADSSAEPADPEPTCPLVDEDLEASDDADDSGRDPAWV